jgi:hypothetical protein
MSKSKVFCIGANKTGTSTLESVLRGLGLRVPNQQEQEMQLVDAVREGNFSRVVDFCNKYDAFQDAPFSKEHNYIIFDALFPDSKFILTIRPQGDWYKSLVRFHKKTFRFKYKFQANERFFKDRNLYLRENYTYENATRNVMRFDGRTLHFDWKRLYHKRTRIKYYLARNEDAVRYFLKRPDQLLVIDVTKELDTSRIVEFLGFSEGLISKMPHMNKT